MGRCLNLEKPRKRPFYGQRNSSCFRTGSQGHRLLTSLQRNSPLHRLSILQRNSPLHRLTSLQRQPSPPPRQPSPSTAGTMRGKRSSKHKRSPLPKVPHKNLPIRPYDRTEAENAAEVAAYNKTFFAPKKPEQKPVYDEKTKKWRKSFLEQPSQISMNLQSDYGRELSKLARAQSEHDKERRAKGGKQIARISYHHHF